MANLSVVKDTDLEKKIEEWRRLDKVGPPCVSVAVDALSDPLCLGPVTILQCVYGVCVCLFSLPLPTALQWEGTRSEIESMVNMGNVNELRSRLCYRMKFGTAGDWHCAEAVQHNTQLIGMQ